MQQWSAQTAPRFARSHLPQANENAVTGFLSATADGSDLAKGGRYDGLMVAGFDAGASQKNAVRNGWFIGSVTQDPYMIGYYAVELAV